MVRVAIEINRYYSSLARQGSFELEKQLFGKKIIENIHAKLIVYCTYGKHLTVLLYLWKNQINK